MKLRKKAVVELMLPFPPSVNNLFSGTARRFPSPRYKQWRRDAEVVLQAQSHTVGYVAGPVMVSIAFCRPDKRKRDLGNLEKAVTDFCVEHGLMDDDSNIQEIILRWARGDRERIQPGTCEVRIEEFVIEDGAYVSPKR